MANTNATPATDAPVDQAPAAGFFAAFNAAMRQVSEACEDINVFFARNPLAHPNVRDEDLVQLENLVANLRRRRNQVVRHAQREGANHQNRGRGHREGSNPNERQAHARQERNPQGRRDGQNPSASNREGGRVQAHEQNANEQ